MDDFYKYDFTNKTQTIPVSGTPYNRAALAAHPSDKSIISVIYEYAQKFYIYNIDANNFTQGPDLNYAHTSSVCIVDTFSYQQNTSVDPYLYVFGGDSIYIERFVNSFHTFLYYI